MEKYRDTAKKRLANKKNHGQHETHPEVLAQQAHVDGQFASRTLDEFFTTVHGEILVDLFIEWLQTAPHETKTREFLYSTAMALGSTREKLVQMETYGRNVPVVKEMEKENGTGSST